MEAKADVTKWYYNNEEIEHRYSSLYRVIGGILACTLLMFFEIITGASFIPCFFSFAFMYWFMFDLSTNIFSNRRLFQIGSSSDIDIVTKKIIKKEKKVVYIKLACILISTTITILFLL